MQGSPPFRRTTVLPSDAFFSKQPVNFLLGERAFAYALGYVDNLGIWGSELEQGGVGKLIVNYTVGLFEDIGTTDGN